MAAGEGIFREGDAADAAYIVDQGLVAISKSVDDDAVVIGIIAKEEMLGEMGLIGDAPRSGTARAVEPTALAVVPGEAFQPRLERADPVIRQLLTLLARCLRAETTQTARRTTVVR